MSGHLKPTSKLAGKNVLVLGGTSGIGFSVAKLAVEHNANVIVSSSNPDKLGRAVERLRTAYPDAADSQISGYTCDLGNKETIESNILQLLDKVTKNGTQKLNHIAYTAGDLLKMPKLTEVTFEQIDGMQTVRIYGAILLAKHVQKYIEISPASSITFTGGTNTDKPSPNFFLGSMVGGSIHALSKAFAVDLKPVRVNLVSPGAVFTELFSSFGSQEVIDGVLEQFKKETLTGEYGNPDDTAEAYIYLMKDRFAAGAVVDSNGGRLLA